VTYCKRLSRFLNSRLTRGNIAQKPKFHWAAAAVDFLGDEAAIQTALASRAQCWRQSLAGFVFGGSRNYR
jgi:hypothetical protein